MKSYDPQKIEAKWQKYWEKKKLNKATENSAKKKFFSLIEFPYPSGDGLHVGHIRSNTAMDIISRKRRAEGYEVLYPIGWDAFGLPTENYAIKTGIHPTVVTKKNTANFRKQLKSLGFSFDWSREINTTDPAYYKWTQWIFLKFLEKGLAYKKKMAINWCPKDKIGLANEEVVDGKCERCGTPVEKREKEQWMLAITKYADRLDRDLDSKKILIGTRNPAKVKMIRASFAGVAGIELVTLDDISPIDDSVLVEGDDFKENAKLKSEFYFKKTGIPTISTDHILWIEKWPENKGFMVHMRKHANPESSRATDEEVLVFLKNFLKTVGGSSKANFHYALSYTDEKGSLVVDEVPHHYILQTEQAKNYWPGYPTEALLKDVQTGLFKSEQSDDVRYAKVISVLKEKFVPRIFGENTPVNYLEKIRIQQKNWIGRSEGVNFKCKIKDLGVEVEMYNSVPQTFRAETFTVIAPEHFLVPKLVNGTKYEKEVLEFVEKIKQKKSNGKFDADKEIEGVFTGRFVENFAGSGRDLPIWVASYVVADYGTGIVNCSAHDLRDFAFAKKYNIPLHPVAEYLSVKTDGIDAVRKDLPLVEREAITAIVKHWSEDKYIGLKWKKVDWDTFITGGVEKGQTPEEAARAEILEETGYQNLKLVRVLPRSHAQFFHVPKNENRFAHFSVFVFQLVNDNRLEVSEKEKEKHDVVWLTPNELKTFRLPESHRLAWEQAQGIEKPVVKNGILQEPAEFKGREWAEVRNDIINFIVKNGWGSRAVHYKLRDWVFSRQRYWGEPIPVIHCPKCYAREHGTNCVIVHGCPDSEEKALRRTYDKHWMPWIRKELLKFGVPVQVPLMPEPWQASYKHWKKNFEKLSINEESILIGHSCGTAFLVRWLGETKKKVAGLILVAPWKIPMYKGSPTKEDFYDFEIDSGIRDRIKNIFIFTSDSDYEEGKQSALMYHDVLKGKLINLDGKGHYTISDMNTNTFPELIDVIASFISAPVPVPEKDLPVKLPNVKNYKPTDTGESPLSAMTKWVNVKCPKCKGPAKRETDTMPNWAGSSWYYLAYAMHSKLFQRSMVNGQWSKALLDYWTPVDWYNGGMEHTTLHLLYSRFWHKFLFDLGLVPTSEPYVKRTSQGIILAEDGTKMAKSRPETLVSPEKLIETFGADTLRLYEMFMGPFDQHIVWSTESMVGPRRFLEKVWKLQERIENHESRIKNGSNTVFDGEGSNVKCQMSNVSLLHRTIKKVSEDIEAMRFNTAVSAMMVLVNEMEKTRNISQESYEILLRLLAPFAPHISEELWSSLGHKKSIHFEPWPVFDASIMVTESFTLVVQVNGRVRSNILIEGEITEEEARSRALSLPEVVKWLDGKEVKKVIYVKGRIINVVV